MAAAKAGGAAGAAKTGLLTKLGDAWKKLGDKEGEEDDGKSKKPDSQYLEFLLSRDKAANADLYTDIMQPSVEVTEPFPSQFNKHYAL